MPLHQQLSDVQRSSFATSTTVALFEGELWRVNAMHANAMAARLRAGVEGLPGVSFAYPTQSNGVFARLPEGVADLVRDAFFFYDWDAPAGEVRWMCTWDTTEADVDALADAVREAVGG